MLVNKSNVRKTEEVKEIVSTIIEIYHVKKIDTQAVTNMSA